MTIYAWPLTTAGFTPARFEFGSDSGSLASASILSGQVQTSGVPGKRWKASMLMSGLGRNNNRAQLEAFLDRLNGQEHGVSLWHVQRKGIGGWGYPAGTLNQTGVTVKTTAAQFANSVTITGCGNTKTLAAGDFFSVNGQLLMCPTALTSTAGGDITVPVTGGLRAAAVATAPITLIRPTANFILAEPNWRSSYLPGSAESLALDFVERF